LFLSLIFGLKIIIQRTIAQYIFEELEHFSFENSQLEHFFEFYKIQYEQGFEPSSKTLLYNEDANIRNLVVSITMFPYELSQRWDDVMENMNILNRDISIQDVQLSLNYFKLHKIKKMFEQNQRDMQYAESYEEQMKFINVHKQLKEIEIFITKELGTVILK
jgi:DNA primase